MCVPQTREADRLRTANVFEEDLANPGVFADVFHEELEEARSVATQNHQSARSRLVEGHVPQTHGCSEAHL